jgi:hypothetical protein
MSSDKSQSNTVTRQGKAALRYAKAGRRVFPIKPKDKVPLVAGGFKAASAAVETVLEWWKRWPDAGIGFPTGGGVLVVDVDPRNGGIESFYRVQEENGRFPETLTCATGAEASTCITAIRPIWNCAVGRTCSRAST